MRERASVIVLCVMFYISGLIYAEPVCKEWDIKLPKNIRIERAFFDSFISNNLFLIGEGGNGIFRYDIHNKKLVQIYYSRVLTESVKQTSIKNLQFELFYNRGMLSEIDIYSPSTMAKIKEKEEPCQNRNGKIFCTIDGKEREIAPILGDIEIQSLSTDNSLLLFASKRAGGYLFGTKTGEIARLGFGSDFKFANKYDIIFVNNSKIGESCTDSYIYYWLNSAIDTFLIYRGKDGCIRYPDANKEELIFTKEFKLYRCPLDLMNAVLFR
ncbi:MAG: hypothetical protein ACP5QK_07830 [Myxococcota bacterium]